MAQFERSICLGMILLLLALVPPITFSFFGLHKLVDEQNRLISINTGELFEAQRLQFIDSRLSWLMPTYVLLGDPVALKTFNDVHKNFEDLLDRDRGTEHDPEVRAMLVQITTASRQQYAFVDHGVELKRDGASIEVVNRYFLKHTLALKQEISTLLNQLIAKRSSDLQAAKARLRKNVSWVINILTVISLLAGGLVIAIGRLMSKVVQQKRSFEKAQRQLVEQERQLSQARKEVVEIVSHDLKNPLGSISMSTELILRKIAGAQFGSMDLKSHLQIILRSAQSMEKLINNLLDHTRIEIGHLFLELETHDLVLLVYELIQRFQPQAHLKSIELLVRNSEPSVLGRCDLIRIEQVLSNLIANAIKFTPEKGRIAVSVQTTGQNISITVADSGPGMEKDQLPHIFERYWQARSTAARGTGLGLAISKAIVEAHEGEIWVDSECGKGSTFHVSLPGLQSGVPRNPLPEAPEHLSFASAQ